MRKIQIQKHNYLIKLNMIRVQMLNKHLENSKYWTWKFQKKTQNKKDNSNL